jgi:hypothetical protein
VLQGPGGELCAPPQVELAQDLADVRLGGSLGNGELGGNLAVGKTSGQQRDYLLFASGEPFRRSVSERRRVRPGCAEPHRGQL